MSDDPNLTDLELQREIDEWLVKLWPPMITRHPMWPDVTDLSKERDVLLAHAARLNASFDPLRRAFAEAYGIEVKT